MPDNNNFMDQQMNIKFDKDEVVIRIPYSKDLIAEAPLTSTGGSRMLASTKGFKEVEGIPENVKISVMLIAPLPKEERPKKT